MSHLRATLCAGSLAAAAVLLPAAAPGYAASPAYKVSPAHPAHPVHPAHPAHAAHVNDDVSGLAVTPSSPAPGSDVRLRVADCAQRTATAVSAVFVADVLLTASGGTLVGESRIRSTAAAGTYDVRVACGDTDRTGTITVGDKRERQPRRQPGSARPEPVRPGPARPASPASPVAPVEAGGGGTARLAAAKDRETGPGAGHVVTGLVLVGVAAVAVVLGGVRRRNRRSG